MRYDLVIIGGGPGGYVSAIRARHQGLKVALVEKDKMGGTCLIRGCIPTKTLLKNSDVVRFIRTAKDFGIDVSGFTIDYEKMKQRKDDVVADLWKKVTQLVKSHGVELFEGEASFVNRNEIAVRGQTHTILETDKVIIATGSVPTSIPSAIVDQHRIHDSTSILEMTKLPKELIVLGGGYIGCEFACLYAELGVKVTIVEFLNSIVETQGKTISSFLSKSFEARGITLRCGVKMETCETTDSGVLLHLSDGSTLAGDCLLVSVGRKPYTEGLGLDKIGLGTNPRGFIDVNSKMETVVPGIYAIGDVTGKVMLAHVASHQGIIAADNVAERSVEIDYKAVPAVIFTHPEIATVGYSYDEALKDGYDAKSTQFPFAALGKAQAGKETEGFAEIISVEGTGQIIGAAMVGHESGNMIASMALAIEHELTLESVADTIHAHPTLAESWMEAAHLALGAPLHLPPSKR